MAQFIYSRVSTNLQDTQNQVVRLREQFPNAKVFEETASGAKSRPELDRLIKQLQSGDELIVSSLDRLGRRAAEVILLVEELDRRKVILKSLRENIDFSTLAGRFVFQILAALSEMERRLISERTKSALQARKQLGVKLGRPRKHSAQLRKQAQSLRSKGKTLQSISDELNIPIPSLQYLLKV